MVLNRLVGHILIALAVWVVLVSLGRLTTSRYRSLYSKLASSKEINGWEEAYLYYYRYSMRYLRIAFTCVSIFALAYYLPLILPALFGINDMPAGISIVRKYTQVFTIILGFFVLVAYHRCHYQVDMIHKELNKKA